MQKLDYDERISSQPSLAFFIIYTHTNIASELEKFSYEYKYISNTLTCVESHPIYKTLVSSMQEKFSEPFVLARQMKVPHQFQVLKMAGHSSNSE